MIRYRKTERVGVNAVERIVIDELEWIFREQPIQDMGIDAHIERVDEKTPTGKIVGVQIKTGESHFKEKKDFFVYYGDLTHLEYWINHSLPVLLVAHLPKRNETFWIEVNEETAIKTEKNWKIEIPKDNVFGKKSERTLENIFEGSPAEQKFRKLSLDEPLMRHIESGGKVSVGLEDWVNKSLGRSPVEVFIIDDEGDEILSRKWNIVYIGYDIPEVAQKLFPWADISIDEDFYDVYAVDEDSEDYIRMSVQRATDEDNGIFHDDLRDTIYPYDNSCGEVEAYRLELKLNDLGRAFLVLSEHLNEKE